MTDAAWTRHSALTDPGRHAGVLDPLPDDTHTLLDIVRGLFVHCDYLSLYGLPLSAVSRGTLPVSDRLDELTALSSAPLSEPRQFECRPVVTCRDYALLLCSCLRQKQIAARIRCGFASYFTPGFYQDHWICEYRRPDDTTWRLADPQLDQQHRTHLDIRFDTSNLPGGAFHNAAEAWHLVRHQGYDSRQFGHGDARGDWFMWINLARDLAAINDDITSSWDTWRDAVGNPTILSTDDLLECDNLADAIKATEYPQSGVNIPEPFWQR